MQTLMMMNQISGPKHYLLVRRDVDLLGRFCIMPMAMPRCVMLHSDASILACAEHYVSLFLFCLG